mmetsp:Transcript_60196/g.127512  ORF Transcript_60196/g.127512 Transcript_60196/m.127512 type:complete len:393 (+) Transcript_60196:131-1309(+)
MPPANTTASKEIDRTLKKVDENLRALNAFRQKPQVNAGCGTKGKNADELRHLLEALQRHHSDLRRWSNAPPLGQSRNNIRNKVDEARIRIEREMKRLQEFGREIKSEQHHTVHRAPQIKQCNIDEDLGVELETQKDQAQIEEVKVLTEQLLPDDEQQIDKETMDEFVCKICQVHIVGNHPKLARCSHLFCGDCISTWFSTQPGSLTWAQRAQAKGSVPCPVCKELLHEDNDLYRVWNGGGEMCQQLWMLLSGIRIACANHKHCRSDGGCPWTGTYGDYQKHAKVCNNSAYYEEEEEEPAEHAKSLENNEQHEEVQQPQDQEEEHFQEAAVPPKPAVVQLDEDVPDEWDQDLSDEDGGEANRQEMNPPKVNAQDDDDVPDNWDDSDDNTGELL